MLKIPAIALMFCGMAMADNSSLNLQLPNAGSSYGTDKIRAGDMECSASIGGATNLEMGVTGIVNNAVTPFGNEDPQNPQTKDLGLYARIIIPLDAPRERVNCNTLYQLELQARRLEVQKLQQELENLRKLGGFDG
jgi:hypothetical protein